MAEFVRAYEEWCSKRTSAAPTFHRYAGLVICGAALGNRVWVEADWGRIYPASWLCLVGRTDSHKSASVNLAASLLAQADQSLELPHDFTREKMYEFLAKQPWGLLRWREMGSVLKAMNRDYNAGTLETLIDLWDSPYITKRSTKGAGDLMITWPAISIIAGAKPRWFVENINRADIEGGFLARWMLITADHDDRPEDRVLGFGYQAADVQQRNSMIAHLQHLGTHEGRMERGNGDAEEELQRWWKSWRAKGWNEDSDPADFAGRSGTQVIKLAMCIQASWGPSHLLELEAEAIRKAGALYEYAFYCARPLIERMRHHTRESDQVERILEFIRAEGRAARRDVYRKFKMRKRDLEDLLASMVEAELIIEDAEPPPSGGGHRRVVYRVGS